MKFAEVDYDFLVTETFSVKTRIKDCPYVITAPDGRVVVELNQDGVITLHAGFGYNGASGPTIDKPAEVIEPAASVHDALYGGISRGAIDMAKWRGYIDRMFLGRLLSGYRSYCNRLDRAITRDESRNTGVWSRIKNAARGAGVVALRRVWVARAWTWYFFVRSFGASRAKAK